MVHNETKIRTENLLVVQHNVWFPNLVGWHTDELNASEVLGIPPELIIVPNLGTVETHREKH